LTILLCCAFAGSAQAEAPSGESGLLNGAAEFTKEYLSDKRRAGALVGSVLGAALTVHPAGSIVGSILGFWVGKATMHEDPVARAAAREQGSYHSQRSIVPADGTAVASLSFAEPGTTTFEPIAAPPAASPAGTVPMPTLAMLPGSAPVSPLGPLGGRLPTPPSRDQLAMLCGNGGSGRNDSRLRNACFYFQGH
jgi:hypothetical protein